MHRQSLASPADDRVTLRGCHDKTDFEIMAQIRNDPARKQYGGGMTPVGASSMESLVSTPEWLRIAG